MRCCSSAAGPAPHLRERALEVLVDLLPRLWKPAGPPFTSLADEAAWWVEHDPRRRGRRQGSRSRRHSSRRRSRSSRSWRRRRVSRSSCTRTSIRTTFSPRSGSRGSSSTRSRSSASASLPSRPSFGRHELGHSRRAVIERLDRLTSELGPRPRARARLGDRSDDCVGRRQRFPRHARRDRSLAVGSSSMTLRAVLFDVDFTLVKPGPDLGPGGLPGARSTLRARARPGRGTRTRAPLRSRRSSGIRSSTTTRRSGCCSRSGSSAGWAATPSARYECAVEMTRGWEHAENFELYEDTLPVLGALREHGLKIGLVSNTGRDLAAFVAHHALDVDAAVGSGAHGKTKPHPAIFLSALDELGIRAEEAAMVGDSPEDDIAGRPRARDAGVPRRPRGPLPGGGWEAAGPPRPARGSRSGAG